ncbi:MAG TPA: dienelactone hydrolase family protein [Levilinea sp.]|nr:dienelactone hydrolase family protein [Levilinea sp.]
MDKDPHVNQVLRMAGAPLSEARAAMIMIHGRGAMAEDILSLSAALDQKSFTFLAPQAAGNQWYPNTFRAPLETNQPWLDSALKRIGDLLKHLNEAGIPPQQVILLGFSQGACLVLEYAARNPRRYGGVVGLSGGLIGPDRLTRSLSGSLEKTPVFLGCSDQDAHIPLFRVQEASAALRSLNGMVTERIYAGMEHTVNLDEIEHVMHMVAALLA